MSSPTETLTFTPYAEDRFQRVKVTLAKDGLKLPVGETGEVKDFGADVEFNHNGNTLTLIVKHGPHLHNYDDFVEKLKTWVQSQA
jgi:hypothetical protein